MAVERRRPEHDYGAGTGGCARPSSSKRRMTSHLSPPAHSVTDPSRTCPPTQYGRHTIVTGARPPSPTRSPSYDAPRAHAPVPVPGCACLLHDAGHRCNAAAALGSRRPQEPHPYVRQLQATFVATFLSFHASAPHQPTPLAPRLTFNTLRLPLQLLRWVAVVLKNLMRTTTVATPFCLCKLPRRTNRRPWRQALHSKLWLSPYTNRLTSYWILIFPSPGGSLRRACCAGGLTYYLTSRLSEP